MEKNILQAIEPELRFIDAKDPKFIGTIEAAERYLRKGDYLYRYHAADDFVDEFDQGDFLAIRKLFIPKAQGTLDAGLVNTAAQHLLDGGALSGESIGSSAHGRVCPAWGHSFWNSG